MCRSPRPCGRCAARTREIGSLSDATIGIIESWVSRSGQPVWSNLKRSLANLVKQDIGQLTALVKTRLRRMQYRPGLLEGFLAKPGLDLGNFHNCRSLVHYRRPFASCSNRWPAAYARSIRMMVIRFSSTSYSTR